MSNVTQLRTRKPTGKPSWPLILLAGEAKTGKTYRAAEFTGDERVGRSFMLDLGEGCADEYGSVPGADYEIIDHNGTWVDIIAQVEAVRDFARAELAAGNKPVCLIIDSMTAEWAMLCAWTDTRARRSKSNRALLAADPDAEIDITSNYWNDATSRHNRLMNILKTFPGIVIMTTLETEKTQFGPNGKPVAGAPKVARPDGQKRLTADATAWIRLSLDSEPTVVGLRSLRQNVTPGKDRPQPWADFTVGKLVFEFLGLSTDVAAARDIPVLDADQVVPGEEPEPEQPPHGGGRPASHQRPNGNGRAQRQATVNVLQVASRGVDAMIAASDAVEARRVADYATTCAAAAVDVSGFLTNAADSAAVARLEQVRENLGIIEGEPVTLADFGALVASYWETHGRPVDSLPDAPAATEAPAVAEDAAA